MPDDLRIRELVEDALESGMSPEAACADDPELLPYVRERRERFRRVEALLDDIFPEPGATSDRVGSAGSRPGGDLPEIPGYEVGGRARRAAAWASSTGPGTRARPHGRPQDDRCRRLRRAGGAWRASAARPRRWRSLRHPNIVQVYEVGDVRRPALLRDGVRRGRQPGAAARRRAPGRRGGPPSWWRRWPAPSQHAHQRGIVHRDLKPANILLAGGRHAEDHRLRPGPAARGRAGD